MSSAADPSTDRRAIRGQATRQRIVEAARDVLVAHGHGGASTRAVAEAAGVNLSQVHYHFGGRQGLLIEVLHQENDALLERQRALYAAPGPLSEKWRIASDFLDQDLESGYVRVLWELWAAGLTDPELAAGWREAVERLARPARVGLLGLGRGPRDRAAAQPAGRRHAHRQHVLRHGGRAARRRRWRRTARCSTPSACSSSGLSPRPRMRLEVHVLEALGREVRVDLRGGDVGVAEHLLQ